MENEPASDPSEAGSNSFLWWTRSQSIRTLTEVSLTFPLTEADAPQYQRLAPEIARLRRLGLSRRRIGRELGIDGKTVEKALRSCEGHKRFSYLNIARSVRSLRASLGSFRNFEVAAFAGVSTFLTGPLEGSSAASINAAAEASVVRLGFGSQIFTSLTDRQRTRL